MDTAWRERAQFSSHWGVYEIGISSPIFRVFFPQDQRLAGNGKAAQIDRNLRFFPDGVGRCLYRLRHRRRHYLCRDLGIYGGLERLWRETFQFRDAIAAAGLHSRQYFFEPSAGPLGIANSALVLFSIIVSGLAIDLPSFRAGPAPAARELKLGTSV
jgi:hypothetical protein